MDRNSRGRKNQRWWSVFHDQQEMVWPQEHLHFFRVPAHLIWNISPLSVRPFYLPREFSSIIVTAVYIPPQADTSLALFKLHDVLSGYINKHSDVASIIMGDFNKASFRQVMPNFHQHVSCPTRGPNTLDHCYTQFKNAYKARSLPAFGKSDHAAIFLITEYKQRLVQEPPVEREVTCWSSHSEAML